MSIFQTEEYLTQFPPVVYEADHDDGMETSDNDVFELEDQVPDLSAEKEVRECYVLELMFDGVTRKTYVTEEQAMGHCEVLNRAQENL